jgi:hypothetical protein
MHIFSTVLFIEGNPVGYKVFKEEDRLLLNPAENPNRNICPPSMLASNHNGHWLVEGTNDRNLIDQVIEDVTNSEHTFYSKEQNPAP